MAAKLGDAILYLSTQDKGLGSGLQQAESQVQASGGRLSGFMTGIAQGVGQMAFGLVQNAASAAIGAVQGSIDLASDLNESANKVKVVFGENSDAILKWSDTTAATLGQSKKQALDAVGTFGNLFVSMGMASDTSADMSTNLVKLASDLASFNNVDPSVALEKLRAGLLGEAEPLRTLGVNLSASAVEAKALEMGLVKADVSMTKVNGATLDLEQAQAKAAAALKKHGESSLEYRQAQQSVAEAEEKLQKAMEGSKVELTAAQKAQATYALILEQTKTAQNDFANTSDGMANQQRIQAALWEDTKTKIGTGLLPIQMELNKQLKDLTMVVMPPLVELLVNRVIPAIQSLVDWFKSLSPEAKQTALIVIGVAGAFVALLPVIMGISGVIGVLTPIVSGVSAVFAAAGPVLAAAGAAVAAIGWPVTLLIGAIALLAAAWYNNWGGIQEKTAAAGQVILAGFDGLKWGIDQIWQALKDFWAWVTSIATGTMALAITAPAWIVTLVAWTWPGLAPVAWVLALMDWLWPELYDEPSWVSDLIDWAWPKFPGKPQWLQDLLDWVWPTLPSLPTWLGGSGGATDDGPPPADVTGSSLYSLGRMANGLVANVGGGRRDRLAAAGVGAAPIYVVVNVNNPVRSDLDFYRLGRRVGSEVARRER